MAYYIIIRGALGIGKSTIAESLSRDLNAKHISIDRILDEFRLTNDKEEGYVSQKSFIKANEIAVNRVKEDLEKGNPIVFDGNFYWKSQIDDLIRRLDYPHYVFTLRAPLSVCIKRDANRKKTHGKDATEVVYKKSTEFDYGDDIDTEKLSISEIVNKIKKEIKS
jgi:predicted kinase